MYFIFGLGLVAMGCFLVLHFRNIVGVVTPLVVALVSAIWGFGFAGLLGYNLDPLIIVVPVLLVARALSHSVQMCERYFEIYNETRDVRKASVDALVSLFPPGLVGIICDAAGLFIIAIAPIRLIEKLAYVCGLWSLSLVITAVVLTLLLLSYLPAPKNVGKVVLTSERKGGLLYRIFSFISVFSSTPQWSIATCGVFLVVTGVSGWWAFNRGIGDVNPGTPLLWPDSPYNTAIRKINERFAGFDVLQVVVEGKPESIKTSNGLNLMQRFQRYMELDPEVGATFSFSDQVSQVNRLFHGGFPKWGVIPDNDVDSAMIYHLEIGLDVNTLPIGAVGMGIGIDYNIYLMSRMCEEYRINPDYSKLIPASIFTTGKAIFFTATTMVVGIILWYFMSSLRFQAEMGLLLSAVMMAHVILALFFQSAFMLILHPKYIQKGLFFDRRR